MEKSEHLLRMVYSAEEIALRVSQIAVRINQRYAKDPLVVVCVLKGAFMLFADLVRQLKMPVQTDFVRLSSYGGNSFSCRDIRLVKDVECELGGRNVLIVEDIVDSGMTLSYLTRLLTSRGASSLRLVSLLDKPSRRTVPLTVDYSCFQIPDAFVVGYGLDYDEKYRNLPVVGVLDPKVYTK